MVKNLPAMKETWVLFLGWKDSLDKGMTTHSSILARRIPWREEPGGLLSMGLQTDTSNFFSSTIRRAIYFTHFTDIVSQIHSEIMFNLNSP